MRKGSLYTLNSFDQKESAIAANLELYPDAPIFLGHFPGQPVLPGACMLQIVKEILEKAFEKPVRLKIANQMKFLKVIDPRVNKIVDLEMTYKIDQFSILVSANMSAAGEIVFKLKGTFILFE